VKLFRRLALAALALAAPAAASAQAPETQAIPPQVLTPNADAQALFETLRQQPATGDLLAGMTAEQTAPIDALNAELFRRGETVADWQRQGVNMRTVLAALPGGRPRT